MNALPNLTARHPAEPREDHLDAYTLKSWLLTTDHKRIAILYLISISFAFLLGGIFATLIRLELLTPQGDLFESDTYNKHRPFSRQVRLHCANMTLHSW